MILSGSINFDISEEIMLLLKHAKIKITSLQVAFQHLERCNEQLTEAKNLAYIGMPASIFSAEVAVQKAKMKLHSLL